MISAEKEEHKDFICEYKKFQTQFNKLYWRKHPDWFLAFKEFNDETFKPISEYQGFYFISNYGKVVSFKRKLPAERCSKMVNDFFAVSLNHFGFTKLNYIHELVYTNFVGKMKPFHRVVHKDNDVTNNYYKNLQEVKITELIDRKNVKKSDDTSSITNIQPAKVEKPGKPANPTNFLKPKKQRKSRKPKNELDAGILQFSKEGKFIREFLSIREAVRDLKIDSKSILACLKGKSKIAGGFQWLYRVDPNFDNGIFDIKPVPLSKNRSVKPI